jgi:hypothetical protein
MTESINISSVLLLLLLPGVEDGEAQLSTSRQENVTAIMNIP